MNICSFTRCRLSSAAAVFKILLVLSSSIFFPFCSAFSKAPLINQANQPFFFQGNKAAVYRRCYFLPVLFSQKKVRDSFQVDPQSREFLEWLYQTRGCEGEEGVVEIGSSERQRQRGLYASNNIEKGDYIFAIPFPSSLVIEDNESTDAERGYKFLQLQRKLQSHPSSYDTDWKPYFDILPTNTQCSESMTNHNFGPTPDFWSDEDIAKLELPEMIEMVMEHKRSIETLAQKYRSISLAELQFATWLVNSRGITLVDSQNNEEIDDDIISEYPQDDEEDREDGFSTTCVMIPLLDMINHSSSNFNTYLTVLGGDGDDNESDDEEELFYAVIARRDIQKGEELLISYGSQEDTSLELLLHYGFVPDDNPFDVDYIAWTFPDKDEMLSCWSTTLQQDQQQLQKLETVSDSNLASEKTILKFRIRMKQAYQEYKDS